MKAQSILPNLVRLSFIVPAMSLLLVLTLYPLYLVLEMSFLDFSNYTNPVFTGLTNYVDILKDPLFWTSLKNTLIFTFFSVLLVITVGISFAVLLNQKINVKIRGFFRSVIMFPWLLSSAVVGSIWVLILSPFGLLNWFLQNIGIINEGIAWLSDERFALLGLIIANVWRGFPFAMLMLLAAFQTVPEDTMEAAEVDGANRFIRFFYIVIPQVKGMLLTVITLELIWTFRTFDLVYIMTGGGPIHSTEILSTYVYFNAFQSLDFGHASATSIFMLISMVFISSFYLKGIIKKEEE